jgi:hypothetical protein
MELCLHALYIALSWLLTKGTGLPLQHHHHHHHHYQLHGLDPFGPFRLTFQFEPKRNFIEIFHVVLGMKRARTDLWAQKEILCKERTEIK